MTVSYTHLDVYKRQLFALDILNYNGFCRLCLGEYLVATLGIPEFLGMHCCETNLVFFGSELQLKISFGNERLIFPVTTANHRQSWCLDTPQRIVSPGGDQR